MVTDNCSKLKCWRYLFLGMTALILMIGVVNAEGSSVNAITLIYPAPTSPSIPSYLNILPQVASGQNITFSASWSGGTPPYTVKWYHSFTSVFSYPADKFLCDTSEGAFETYVGKETTNTVAVTPMLGASETSGFQYYCYSVADSASPPTVVPSYAIKLEVRSLIFPVAQHLILGQSAQFSGGQGAWSIEAGTCPGFAPSQNSSAIRFMPTAPTNDCQIKLTVTDTKTGAEIFGLAKLFVYPPLVTPNVSLSRSELSVGQNVILTATEPGGTGTYSYLWAVAAGTCPGLVNSGTPTLIYAPTEPANNCQIEVIINDLGTDYYWIDNPHVISNSIPITVIPGTTVPTSTIEPVQGTSNVLSSWAATSIYPTEGKYRCVATSDAIYCGSYYAKILNDDALGPWMPSNGSVNGGCAVTSNAIYCPTGYTSILSSGELSSGKQWSLTRPASARFDECLELVATPKAIYCIGGDYDGSYRLDRVYYAEIHPDLGLGPWINTTPISNNSNSSVFDVNCFTVSNMLYCISSDRGLNKVYYTNILSDQSLGNWTVTNSYLIGGESLGCAESNDMIYCIGGWTTGSSDNHAIDNVYYTNILPNGGLNAWVEATSYPLNVIDPGCVATSSAIYCVTGSNASQMQIRNVFYAKINTHYTHSPITIPPTTTIPVQNTGVSQNIWQSFINWLKSLFGLK